MYLAELRFMAIPGSVRLDGLCKRNIQARSFLRPRMDGFLLMVKTNRCALRNWVSLPELKTTTMRVVE